MEKLKVKQFLDKYQQKISRPEDDQEAFYLGNCYVQLGDYTEAQRQYERSIKAMFGPKKYWKDSSQVNWLVDTFILSGKTEYYPHIKDELDIYKIDYRGKSLIAQYAYAIMALLYPSDWDIRLTVLNLLKRPKLKDMYAIGWSIQAIVDKDEPNFNNSLEKLLIAHEGMVKHGSLKWTAEGLICMQAMALTLVARKHGLNVHIDNDYLPLGYLDFLLEENSSNSEKHP